MPPIYRTIRVKITQVGVPDPIWYASSAVTKNVDDATWIKHLNTQAALRNVRATYELATEEDYQAYRKSNVPN